MTPLSKTERGRFKKLSKRAHSWNDAVGSDKSHSGIATDSDWYELEQLHQRDYRTNGGVATPTAADRLECSVQVHMRLKAGGDNQQRTVSVASHRALLFRFLSTINSAASATTVPNSPYSNSKRKRQSTTSMSTESTLYSWACLHNLAAVSNVVVWDLVVESSEAALELESRLLSIAQRVSRSVVTVPTHWFERNQQIPKSVSDGLYYEPPPSTARKRDQTSDTMSPKTLENLVVLLEPLIAAHESLENEGYPLTQITSDSITRPLELSPRGDSHLRLHPSNIDLESACVFVCDFQTTNVTNATSPCKDSNLAEFDLLPYVVSTESSNAAERRVFALDCEMVETRHGLELARITLCQLDAVSVDDTDNSRTKSKVKIATSVVFDSLVRPRNTVLNYLTQYSGVTAALLNPPAAMESPTTESSRKVVRLEQVQAALLRTVHPSDILVGHSLENDLHACRFVHTTVIDTALLFRRCNRKDSQGSTNSNKFALRHLAAVLLRKPIQSPDQPHCSEEDAVTALELAVNRAIHGPSFVMADKSSQPTNLLIQRTKDLTTVAVGPLDWLQRHIISSSSSLSSAGSAIHALQCASVHESNSNAISSWLTGPKRRADVVCAQFDLSKSKTLAPHLMKAEDEWKRFEILAEQLLAKLSSRAVVLVTIQAGFARANELTRSRHLRQNRRATIPWSDDEECERKRAMEACRLGHVLWIGGSSTPRS